MPAGDVLVMSLYMNRRNMLAALGLGSVSWTSLIYGLRRYFGYGETLPETQASSPAPLLLAPPPSPSQGRDGISPSRIGDLPVEEDQEEPVEPFPSRDPDPDPDPEPGRGGGGGGRRPGRKVGKKIADIAKGTATLLGKGVAYGGSWAAVAFGGGVIWFFSSGAAAALLSALGKLFPTLLQPLVRDKKNKKKKKKTTRDSANKMLVPTTRQTQY